MEFHPLYVLVPVNYMTYVINVDYYEFKMTVAIRTIVVVERSYLR